MLSFEIIITIIMICAIIDTIAIGVGLYMIKIVQPRYPDWWRRVIIDDAP